MRNFSYKALKCLLVAIACLFYQQSILAQLQKLEYAFNTDPGPGNGTVVVLPAMQNFEGEQVLDVSSLPTGIHRLFYRVQDVSGYWSMTNIVSFFKFPGNDNSPEITQLEYFFDNDPGYGNGTAIPFQPGNIVSDIFSFPVTDNGALSRTLYVRAMDNRGAWSLLHKQVIDMCQLYRTVPDFDFINFGNLYTFSDSSRNDPSGYYKWKFFNNNILLDSSSLSHPQVELPAGLNTVRLIRGIGCRRDSIDRPVTIGKISDYSPRQAEAGANMILFLYGAGLDTNAIVSLKQTGNPVNSLLPVRKTSHSRQQLALYFDLHQVTQTGSYVIEVIFSNGAIETLDFEVLPADLSEPSITVQLNGPINIRANIPTLFHITLTNTSNKYASGVPLYIALPDYVVPDFTAIPSEIPEYLQELKDSVSTYILVDSIFGKPYTGKIYSILLSGINPQQTISVPVRLQTPLTTAPAFEMHAWTDKRLFGSPLQYLWGKCFDDAVFFVLGFIPAAGCLAGAFDFLGNLADQGITGNQNYKSMGSGFWGFVSAIASCIPGASLITKWKKAQQLINLIIKYRVGISRTFDVGVGGTEAINDCNETDEDNEKDKNIQVGNPKDPNEILGPAGYGPERYIANPGKMGYTISFENLSSATAPAQRVYVLDTLDKSKFDFDQFELNNLTIGDSIYFIPPGLGKYTQLVKIKHLNDVDVLANIKLDTVTGILNCTFLSVDPVTKELIDPSSFLGFLPPNLVPVDGEGSISYSVKIKKDLPSGTIVSNRAGIIFDIESPLMTNTWVNTIDITPPQISNLAAQLLNDTTAHLTFSSSDQHSGVRGHKLYMAVDGGATKFMGMMGPDTLRMKIRFGSNYRFYAIPVDNVGNVGNSSNEAVITPNTTSGCYIIYARKEARFGEENSINGNVGVTDAQGKAEFKRYSVLDPYQVMAKNINVQQPASVNNLIYEPATGGPITTSMQYSGGGLTGNHTQNANGTVPVGNFKNLIIKQGITAIIHGNNYGKIVIEEGANVTFTGSNIFLEELEVRKGKKNVNTSKLMFSQSANVIIRDRVKIEEDCKINEMGPTVFFYLDDNKKDEENFKIKGDNTTVTLNIIIPYGKLKVTGGARNTIMNGLFIVEKLESDGKAVTWNGNDCNAVLRQQLITSEFNNQPPGSGTVYTYTNQTNQVSNKHRDLKVEADNPVSIFIYPNPARDRILVKGPGGAGKISILDLTGKIVIQKIITQNLEEININTLRPGVYIVRVAQEGNSTTLKLIKQ